VDVYSELYYFCPRRSFGHNIRLFTDVSDNFHFNIDPELMMGFIGYNGLHLKRKRLHCSFWECSGSVSSSSMLFVFAIIHVDILCIILAMGAWSTYVFIPRWTIELEQTEPTQTVMLSALFNVMLWEVRKRQRRMAVRVRDP
jgi:hypothetical protein